VSSGECLEKDVWLVFAVLSDPTPSGTRPSGGFSVRSNLYQLLRSRQAISIKEVHDIWPVGFMDYDLGYFDLETRVLEPVENPFGPKVLPVCQGRPILSGVRPEQPLAENQRVSQ
jgi:hypothetical protein